jgi:hypothetical protein
VLRSTASRGTSPIDSAGGDTDIDHIVYEVDSESEGGDDVHEEPSESAEAELSKTNLFLQRVQKTLAWAIFQKHLFGNQKKNSANSAC